MLEQDYAERFPNYQPLKYSVEQIVGRTNCSPRHAFDAISSHCRAGLIYSRCESLLTRGANPPSILEKDIELPFWFWEETAQSPETIVDWRTGRVSGLASDEEGEFQAIATGIIFETAGIGALIDMMRDEAATNLPSEDNKTSSGRKRSSIKWDLWIAELVTYIFEEGIPEGTGADGQDALINAIETRLIERGHETLARSTVQSAARSVLLRLRSAEN